MSLIPAFEIGIWNAWIFVIGYLLPPIISILCSRGKATSKRWNVSAPIRHEKILNVISTTIMFAGVIYSIFLPLQLGKAWFFAGLGIFSIALIISLSAAIVRNTCLWSSSAERLFQELFQLFVQERLCREFAVSLSVFEGLR